MLALDIQAAKNLGIAIIGGFIVLSFVSAVVIKNVVAKLLTMLVMVGLALGVWTQRTALQDCSDRVQAQVSSGSTADTTCRFFGTDVDVPNISIP